MSVFCILKIFTPLYHHCKILGGETYSAITSFQFLSWRLQEQELLRQQQRQCQSLVRTRKNVSQQQENINGVNANQRRDKMKYGRPIWRGMQGDTHVCQRSDEVKYCRPIGGGMQRDVHVCQRSDEVKYGRPIGRACRGAHTSVRGASNMQRMVRIISIYYCWIISLLILYSLSLIMLQGK